MEQKFYICKHCGNIIAKVMHDGSESRQASPSLLLGFLYHTNDNRILWQTYHTGLYGEKVP